MTLISLLLVQYNYAFYSCIIASRRGWASVVCGESTFNPFNPEYTIVIFIHYNILSILKQLYKTFLVGNKNEMNRALGHLCAHIG